MRKWLKIYLISFILSYFVCYEFMSTKVIRQDISTLSNNLAKAFVAHQEFQAESSSLTVKALLVIINELEEINKQQQFIIDQNRENVTKQETIIKEKTTKPSYESLKEHNVYIVGCTGMTLEEAKKNKIEGACWIGTGVVIKITDKETYILTNNHVSGKGEKDVRLYVKNGKDNTDAKIVAQHKTEDIAVIKTNIILDKKVSIPGIALAGIQEPIYIVGNPLGVKNTYTEGLVVAYTNFDLLIQAPCIFGNSGSGVYNQDGMLVGLVYALEQYPGPFFGIPEVRITHSLCVDSITIKAFLKELKLY
jgi:S1-C subfamily serine protease